MIMIIAFVMVFLVPALLNKSSGTATAHPYQGGSGSFVGDLTNNNVRSVLVNTTNQSVQVTPNSGSTYTVNYPDPATLA